MPWQSRCVTGGSSVLTTLEKEAANGPLSTVRRELNVLNAKLNGETKLWWAMNARKEEAWFVVVRDVLWYAVLNAGVVMIDIER